MKDTAKKEVFNFFLLSRTVLLVTELYLKLNSVSSPYYFDFHCFFTLFKNLSGTIEDILETRKSVLLLWQSKAYALGVGFLKLFWLSLGSFDASILYLYRKSLCRNTNKEKPSQSVSYTPKKKVCYLVY